MQPGSHHPGSDHRPRVLPCRPRARVRVGSSRQVLEQLRVLLVALEVLGRDEVLDALLDELEVGLEHARQLLHHLHHQLLVLQHLARLHRAHDGGVDGVLAVLLHVLNHLLLLVHGRQRDLDAVHAVGELVVEAELVGLGDGLAGGVLGQHLVLGARERVQQAQAVVVLQVGALLHLLVAQLLGVVEQQAHHRLHRRHLHRDGLGVKVALEHAVAQRVDPRQAAVLVLRLVELLEQLQPLHHLLGQRQLDGLVGGPEAGGEHHDRHVDGQRLAAPLHPLCEVGLLVAR
mmetsp:Transcript_5165/g.12721  ORF Transcript_5165/g.12721 Transcript_5165/m.12721 type:complete len:288 (-) Transcript_5165:1665-2528(-)